MSAFATAACVIAVALGAAGIAAHSDALQSVVFLVACVWFLANMLVSGATRRAYWKDHNVTMLQFFERARSGHWPQRSGLDKITGLGAAILMLASVGLIFV